MSADRRRNNIALGARRAQNVRDYLAARGVQPQRMRTVSYGKERPVAVCNISRRSQNARLPRWAPPPDGGADVIENRA